MTRSALLKFVLLCVFVFPQFASAAPSQIKYQYDHHIFTLQPNRYPEWKSSSDYWTFDGKEIDPLPEWRVDGDELPEPPEGIEKNTRTVWNRIAIARVLREEISQKFNRPAGTVVISKSQTGGVIFEGEGMLGRRVSVDRLVSLTIKALDENIETVLLPVEETQPHITVTSAELRSMGIKEVVTVGESDYSNSPPNRIHNIRTGLDRFNGHIIASGATFSFVETLGPVNAATGYRPELVILGDKTIPEYGGGLCQVSSTAYRGVWEYGFPITQRKNHSFAVNHYSPQGTDATIYPPNVDIKFVNDSPGALLIQTVMDEEKELAYFIYYGTADERESQVIGPFTWGHVGIPAQRIEYTPELPPGIKKKVGSPVPGMKAAWFRVVRSPDSQEENVEGYYSVYEARPLYYQVGIETSAPATPEQPPEPSWMLNPEETEPPTSSRTRRSTFAEPVNTKPTRRSIIRAAE